MKGDRVRDDIYKDRIIETIQREYGYSAEVAERFHSDMHNYIYGAYEHLWNTTKDNIPYMRL